MQARIKDYPIKDILFVYFIIAYSTVPFFRNNFGQALLLICIFYSHKEILRVLRIEGLYALLLVFVLEFYHFVYFPDYDTGVFRQVVTSFLISLCVVYYLRLNFFDIYIKIMYITAIVSFFFFFSLLVSPSFVHSIDDSIPNIFRVGAKHAQYYGVDLVRVNPIIYNFDYNFYSIRNNGPFWEPTVFASLLLIAQIFNFIIYKKLFNKNGIIFTITILTTLSTTVFVTYFFFLASTILINPKIKFILKIILLAGTAIISAYLYYEMPFLQEKITKQITEVDENIELTGDSRIAGATLDLFEISQDNLYILFGKGSDRDSRIAGKDKTVQRNCGLTGLLIEWGIFFFLIYIALIYYSFYQISRVFGTNTLFALPFTICILIVSFSEVFFELSLFHAFMFFGLALKHHNKQNYNHVRIMQKANQDNHHVMMA
ncbi:hypothetical protein [Spirosoma radiotolerans]|uniref:Uncharacterized protein n=1 Tax=Spirosoma radiotolerans TaxID=1379870 RepID=A0A0E3V9D9_9BACT|nr:hypothetical protein [Spirosoma radiotolerans]AKD57056.1 hypothetical protein SD10_21340 [Spirosoma radiotolerans]